ERGEKERSPVARSVGVLIRRGPAQSSPNAKRQPASRACLEIQFTYFRWGPRNRFHQVFDHQRRKAEGIRIQYQEMFFFVQQPDNLFDQVVDVIFQFPFLSLGAVSVGW